MNKSCKYASSMVLAALALSTTGCHIYQKYETPQSSSLTREYAQAASAQPDSAALGNIPWQQIFTEPMLHDLIAQALENNVDLRNAKLNVDVAQANLQGARMAYLPSVALAPQASNSRTTMAGTSWSGWSWSLPLSVSWEIDVFGKQLNSARAAKESYSMSQDYAQAVRSQIIGAVANCFYAISTLEAQLDIQRATAKVWAQNVDAMTALKEAGRTTEAAVVQSRAQSLSIQASITDLETALEDANTTLSLLLGVMPQRFAIPAGRHLQLPAQFATGVPMEALANRPDVRAQERQLALAYYATNAARSAFYPSLSISANGGFTNSLGGRIIDPAQWFINLGSQLTAPLFMRGQNIARLRAAKAQQEQSLNTFEYTLMKASGEISSALTTYENVNTKVEHLLRQVDCMTQAVAITETLFMQSATTYNTTYLEVLTAQQNLLASEMGLCNARLTQSQAVINLYQALGGGR